MLLEFLQKALELGCDEIEIEYEGGHEVVTAFRGSFGIGIGSLKSGDASTPFFDEIRDLKRKKRVTIKGTTYSATVSTYESFGEWAHRIQLKTSVTRSSSTKKS